MVHRFMDIKNTLEFDSLYLEFGLHKVLQDIYMKCSQGEVIGLLGRNGCGKSSLMKIVFGSMKAYQQSVRINGKHLSVNARRNMIKYLPQESFIPGYLSLQTVLKHYQIEKEQLLSRFPVFLSKIHHPFGELSGGEGRLFEVFVILKSKSHFCILDEPFSNLMPLYIDQIITLINDCRADKGMIITDHLYRYIIPASDRLYFLHQGKTYPIHQQSELTRFGYLPEN